MNQSLKHLIKRLLAYADLKVTRKTAWDRTVNERDHLQWRILGGEQPPITTQPDLLAQHENRYGADFLEDLKLILVTYCAEFQYFLEYGAGNSTAAILEFIRDKPEAEFISIDHNLEYLKMVATSLKYSNKLHLRHIELAGPIRSRTDPEPNYVCYPNLLDHDFDLILVDGRRRLECVLNSLSILSARGIVLLHDFERYRYRLVYSLFRHASRVGKFLLLRNPKTCEQNCAPLPNSKWVSSAASTEEGDSKCVCVCLQGEAAQREFDISRPSIETYANSIGADLLVVEVPTEEPVASVKFHAARHFENYDRTIMLDVDIIIRKGCPNLFKIVPREYLGAWPEGELYAREAWTRMAAELYGDSGSGETLMEAGDYVNTGVLVLSKAHYDLFELGPLKDVVGHPLHEQTYVNYIIKKMGYKVFYLSRDFNLQPGMASGLDWPFGWIIHVAGTSEHVPKYEQAAYFLGESSLQCRFYKTVKWFQRYQRLPRLVGLERSVANVDCFSIGPNDLRYSQGHQVTIWDNNIAYIVLPARGEYNMPVAYGPHWRIARGQYNIHFLIDKRLSVGQHFLMGIVDAAFGRVLLSLTTVRITGEKGGSSFVVKDSCDLLELRLYGGDGEIFIYGIIVENTREASGGGYKT